MILGIAGWGWNFFSPEKAARRGRRYVMRCPNIFEIDLS